MFAGNIESSLYDLGGYENGRTSGPFAKVGSEHFFLGSPILFKEARMK
jgi:hypothetical protein